MLQTIPAKHLPCTYEKIQELIHLFPTPFYLYTEAEMVSNCKTLLQAFSWNKGFREYYAVKAAPNPYLLKILHKAGLGMDCSSLAELELSQMAGVSGEEIMFTSNNTPAREYQRAKELGAIINLDDITHVPYLREHVGFPELISFRLNPGSTLTGTEIIGKPEEAKFGVTREQLFDAYRQAQQCGAKRFGLHTMPISNELDSQRFVATVRMLLEVVRELHAKLGLTVEFINMGGGIGIPYRPEQEAVDITALSREIERCFASELSGSGLPEPKLFMECGRYITGPYGYLITRAIHTKDIYRRYVGVDATMANLMRPGMYGAYHHVSVFGKENAPLDETYDIVGSLCENNDKFAIQRKMPKIDVGDILAIHDAGAHGHSMGFNYNGKLRSAELLLRSDGSVQQIRRAETLADHFATLDFASLEGFLA
jgi:diaminopimelate decarboxylase